MPAIARDMEAAYAALYGRGLPMASGYLIYVLADERTYVHVSQTPRSIGFASAFYSRWREDFQVHSRTFFVNGALFVGGGAARPTTPTSLPATSWPG